MGEIIVLNDYRSALAVRARRKKKGNPLTQWPSSLNFNAYVQISSTPGKATTIFVTVRPKEATYFFGKRAGAPPALLLVGPKPPLLLV